LGSRLLFFYSTKEYCLRVFFFAFKKHHYCDYERFLQNISQCSSLFLLLGPSQSLFKDKTAKYAAEYTYGYIHAVFFIGWKTSKTGWGTTGQRI